MRSLKERLGINRDPAVLPRFPGALNSGDNTNVSAIVYDLHSLGWHSFQQLCLTVTRQILGQTVESFLDSSDGGRDGAFSGTWSPRGAETLNGRFVIQCKFTSKKYANLHVADLSEEVEKARRLVDKGGFSGY